MQQRKYQPSDRFSHIREVPRQDIFPTLIAVTFETIAFYHTSAEGTSSTIHDSFIEILKRSYRHSEILHRLEAALTNRDIQLLDSVLCQRAVLDYFSSITRNEPSDIQQIKQFCYVFKVEVILKWENSHLTKFPVAGAPKIFLSKSDESTFVIHYSRVNGYPDEALKSFCTHIPTNDVVCSNGCVTDKPTEHHYDGQSPHHIYDKETGNIVTDRAKPPCDTCSSAFDIHRNTKFTCKCRICENCIVIQEATGKCIKCKGDYQEIDLAFIEKVLQNKSGRAEEVIQNKSGKAEEAKLCVKCTTRPINIKILVCECELCDHCLSESLKLGSCSSCNTMIYIDVTFDLDCYLSSIMIVETEIICKVCKENRNEAEITTLVCGCKVCATCLQSAPIDSQLSIPSVVDLTNCDSDVCSRCRNCQEFILLSCNCRLCKNCICVSPFYDKCQLCNKSLPQEDWNLLNEKASE